MKILIATNNKHKVIEFKNILSDFKDIELITPKDLGINIEPDENGNSFEENSKIKCIEFYKESKIPVVADDSGLEIDVLDKQPGIYSSRFAGLYASDKDNRIKVLQLLDKVKAEHKMARFRCVICFYDGQDINFFDGTVEGKIINEERGSKGFGYDSIFIPNNYTQTFAELDENIKNKISHRANALKKFSDFLKNKLNHGRN